MLSCFFNTIAISLALSTYTHNPQPLVLWGFSSLSGQCGKLLTEVEVDEVERKCTQQKSK